MNRILVLGGSGFIGSHVCEKASQLRCRVTVPTRRLHNAQSVQSLPWVDPIEADIHDEAVLARLVQRFWLESQGHTEVSLESFRLEESA